VHDHVNKMEQVGKDLQAKLDRATDHKNPAQAPAPENKVFKPPIAKTRADYASNDAGDGKGGQPLSKAERAILQAFYWLKDEQATPAKVAFYSGYSSGSSTSNNALGKLRHGLVSGWQITPAGIQLI